MPPAKSGLPLEHLFHFTNGSSTNSSEGTNSKTCYSTVFKKATGLFSCVNPAFTSRYVDEEERNREVRGWWISSDFRRKEGGDDGRGGGGGGIIQVHQTEEEGREKGTDASRAAKGEEKGEGKKKRQLRCRLHFCSLMEKRTHLEMVLRGTCNNTSEIFF